MDWLLEHGLAAVFVAMLLTPFGFPVPEDVSLLAAGVLVRMGHASFPAAMAVGWTAILITDSIAYGYGRMLGLNPRGLVARLVDAEDIARIERFYRRFGHWTIVVARNLPGSRMPLFFFAGATRVPYGRFLLYDGAAGLFSVALLVGLGHAFGDDVQALLARAEGVQAVGTVVLGLFAGVVLWRIAAYWGRRRARRRVEASRADGAPPVDDA